MVRPEGHAVVYQCATGAGRRLSAEGEMMKRNSPEYWSFGPIAISNGQRKKRVKLARVMGQS